MPSYISQITRILFTAMLLASPIFAQQIPPGWDVSYKSVLDANKVGKDELIRTWLARDKSPAREWFSEWQGKPIVSSILIEFPAFHAAEHTTMWLIRTDDEAFYWEMVEGHQNRNEEPITPQQYDAIYKQVTSWQQLTPQPSKHKDDWPGYFGFLSYHGPGGSKQMLLTIQDFTICLDKTCLPGKVKSGRVMASIVPILIPEARKTYKHKSEAEIARMTPAERIDEQLSEHEYHMWEASDGYGDMLRKYRLKDGSLGFPHLVQLIDSYHPRRMRDDRSANAVMLAGEIDERQVRLRGSPEGRRVIETIERISGRMIAAGKKHSYDDHILPELKALNFTDYAIGDTLWVKYRIKLTDAELVGFINYLIQQDPTYPSWSEREMIEGHSRTNESKEPGQVLVMVKPERYHQAYLAFKKDSGK